MIQTTIAVALTLTGLWVICLNWRVFHLGFVLKKKAPSWIPLLGGLLAWGGMALFDHPISSYGWVGLLVDWGSIPGFAVVAWILATSARSRR